MTKYVNVYTKSRLPVLGGFIFTGRYEEWELIDDYCNIDVAYRNSCITFTHYLHFIVVVFIWG